MSVVSFYWKEANCSPLTSPSCRHLFKKRRCLHLLTMNCFLHSFLRNVSCWAFFPAQSLKKMWGSVVLSDGLLSAISTSNSILNCLRSPDALTVNEEHENQELEQVCLDLEILREDFYPSSAAVVVAMAHPLQLLLWHWALLWCQPQ